jgi:GTPase
VQRSRHGRTGENHANDTGPKTGRAKQRAFCIAALPEGDDLSELHELLRTAGVAVVGEVVQHREKPHANTYLGPGKLQEVKAQLKDADANVVACDDELSPRQERNLEKELGVPVVDRTAIILDIFAGHANSSEGKLQVELAQLQYNLARMRGLWTHLERLGGGIGTRGPGESQIETDRRLARDRISALKRRLAHVQGSRAVMRAERERADVPLVALAGYTNAGKSTLLNRMTGAEVGVRDRLFHTLDPTTRSLRLDGRPFLLTDTVGFIRKLPHQLVDAFGATLEETKLADLLLHVVDASVEEDEMLEMLRAVEDVLEEIGTGDQPRILVLNKADALSEDRRREVARRHPGAVLVSALTGEGLDELGDRIQQEFERTLADIELLVPYSEGKRLAELHDIAGDRLEREDTAEGVLVRARLPRTIAERYERWSVNGAHPA